ncbi:MAG: hypothetical protein ACI8WT_001785 [Clostridium sp.]|jgi:hypothetical protein
MNDAVLNAYNNYKKKYGKDVIIDNITYRAIFKDGSANDIKTIQMAKGIMKYGNYVTYYDIITNRTNTYLINTVINTGLYYDECDMQLCNNILRYKAISDGIATTISLNTIIDNGTISLDIDKYMIMEDNTLSCQIGYCELSKVKNMIVGVRFILNDTVWKIEGINKVSEVLVEGEGIINIKLTSDIFIPEDNRATGVAYNEDIIITDMHTIILTSTVTNTDITINGTGQITTSISDNGATIINPILTYMSSDNNIATVSNVGLITAITEGNSIITVSYISVDNVLYTTTIEITVIIAVARTFTISGANPISNATPIVDKVYTVIDNATGLAVSDLVFTYVSSNLTKCSITSSTNNTVTLHPMVASQIRLDATSGIYSCYKIVSIETGF